MDRFIAAMPAEKDADLMICAAHGVAYQADMDAPGVPYDETYFENYVRLEGQPIARKLNVGRVGLVNRFAGVDGRVVDVGVGSGEFIKSRGKNTYGVDVNPVATAWLKANGLWAGDLTTFTHAFTFWDVIEHIKDPNEYFQYVGADGFLFTSIPIFTDLKWVRQSRHYKPGEHLYYFTTKGFIDWMGCYGFALLDCLTFETDAGRDSILSFAFQRTQLCQHRDRIAQ